MTEQTNPSTDPPDPSTDRLDSWKEIAAYLQRDVRTVQRWEKLAGLPVHRHAESRLRTAYAYRSELDAWWRAQRAVIESAGPEPAVVESAGAEPGTPPESAPITAEVPVSPRRGRLLVASAVVLVATLALAAVALYRFRAPAAVSPPRGAPVAVLLAKVDDQAGNPQLASAIDEALSREMFQDGYLEPVPPARIGRALRLMRRDPATVVTEGLGREIATRDGRIRYVVAARVHHRGSTYFADLKAIDPADSRVPVSLEWQAASGDQLVSRTGEQSRRLAQLAAEAAAKKPGSAETLELVTSASIPAVRLYTAAVQAGARRQWGAAELLARRATAADDRFAVAHAWTGWSMRQQGRRAADCVPWLERAVALSGDASDRESYLVSGMLHSLTGNLPAATAATEAVLRLYPGDRQALDLLIDVSWRAGRAKKAADLSVKRAELYPDEFYTNVRAAHALTVGKGHEGRAADFIARARKRATPEALADRPQWHAWMEILPIFHQWIAGDDRAALASLATLDTSLSDRLGRERDAFAAAVGFAHLAFGRGQQAERAFRFGVGPERQINLAVAALARKDEAAAREWLQQVREHSVLRPALFARVGFDAEAEQGLQAAPPSENEEGLAAVTRGLLAAHRRRFDEATAALRQGTQLLRSTGTSEFFFAIDALVGMARVRGSSPQVTRLLYEAAAERRHTYGATYWSGGHWTTLTADLVDNLRKQGRAEESERVAADLRLALGGAEDQWPAAAVLRQASSNPRSRD